MNEKVSEISKQVDNLEDFIKICTFDYKISEREAKEILRMIREIKEVIVK